MRDLSTTTVHQLNTLPATLTVPEAGALVGAGEMRLTRRPVVGSCRRCGSAGGWWCRRGASGFSSVRPPRFPALPARTRTVPSPSRATCRRWSPVAEQMARTGIIKRGRTWSYVVREPDPATGEGQASMGRWVPDEEGCPGYAIRRGTRCTGNLRRAPRPDRGRVSRSVAGRAHANQVKPSTLRSYREKIDLYLKPSLGSLRLQALSPSRLSVVWRELHSGGGRGGRPASVRTAGAPASGRAAAGAQRRCRRPPARGQSRAGSGSC